jgi:hypothetical protein
VNCRELIATRNWAATPLGPVAQWPASLRATVANILHTRQPMLLFWGPELIQFYNDSFVPSFGQGKHPTAFGQRTRECWEDAWPVVGAQIEAVMTRGEPAWFENALVPISRNGRMEEVFWTYSYSPAFDDHEQIFGTLVIVTEMTRSVIAARRLEALAHVTFALSATTMLEAAFAVIAKLVEQWSSDLPFAFVQSPRGIELSAGISAEHAAALSLLGSRRGIVALARAHAGAVWPEPVPAAVTADIGTRAHMLAFGVSPRLPLDDAYRSFLAQVFDRITSALTRIEVSSRVDT